MANFKPQNNPVKIKTVELPDMYDYITNNPLQLPETSKEYREKVKEIKQKFTGELELF